MLRNSSRIIASSSTSALRRSGARALVVARNVAAPQVARVALKPQSANLIFRSAFHSSSLLLAETVKVPQMAESITEGTLKQWNKGVGDFVSQDEEVATIETDKIDVSVNAPMAGKITELLADEDSTVAVGQDLFKIEPGEGDGSGSGSPAAKEESQPSGAARSEPKSAEEGNKDDAAPAAKKEKDAGDKVLKEQDEKAPQMDKASEAQKPAPKKEEKPAPAPKKEEAPKQEKALGSRNETRVKMSRMRQTISTRLKASQNAAASLTTFNEIDMSSLMEFRKLYKDGILKADGVKLGFMSAFAKASCLALKEIPAANASIEGDTIVYRDYVDLSVAVATPKGLVTPVVRNAESMGLVEIEKAIAELGKKARDNKLGIEDMSGGSFTISNGGVFGSLYGTPIINLPQAAVLGMHAIKEKPVVVDGQIVIRPIMVVALTYDHRLLDGREAVTFLVRIKEYIEDSRRMLLPSPL
ncbi:2-oxoglutarate dehydrogenase E2 component (dihydrolipoamide succinyltransferase) [Kwoniella heveanensis CBS 569]|uniref:dihydrolipoyllysine-residue succinyltransferase n=1 Tax=Kwoniella heveanensis BCC8398 TaxID=1296120 RepID=A0A1B9GW59_9TREE|nr:2-oxoglutarate dehydrogenase E2 component (dihydrolipoamide succinyltransferase) [Kwoniella heveanensis BCC8398]OCF44671.1 2-oxoglutarate dehydrogenase E2 component (dihydrolipoamide succinyltransferase) [Kwoniella heveanensis CBS 569]